MKNEILSIDTITKMVQLEAENKELKETLVKVIDDANTYLHQIRDTLDYVNKCEYMPVGYKEEILSRLQKCDKKHEN